MTELIAAGPPGLVFRRGGGPRPWQRGASMRCRFDAGSLISSQSLVRAYSPWSRQLGEPIGQDPDGMPLWLVFQLSARGMMTSR